MSLSFAGLGLAAFVFLSSAAVAQDTVRPSLLIVGVPHFANPGRDIVNVRAADVTTPERQREITQVVDRLAAFRPTQIAVEWSADDQEKLDQRYAEYLAGGYKLSANEVDQLGLRLASQLGLTRVRAVDWNKMPPGVEADYDFPAWAEAHGRGDEWRARVREQQDEGDQAAALMDCTPISSWISRLNRPSARFHQHRPYFQIAQLGDGTANPGAAWVGSWYARNLRIINNLRSLVNQPDERILVIYGAGHGYLIDQLARESGQFDIEDTLKWLPSSPGDTWTRCPI